VAVRQQGVQGTVVLNDVIGTDGHYKRLEVLAGPEMLQQPAMDAVRQWVYTPYLVEGKPVEVETDVNVVFALQRSSRLLPVDSSLVAIIAQWPSCPHI
jgi:TonB family protein